MGLDLLQFIEMIVEERPTPRPSRAHLHAESGLAFEHVNELARHDPVCFVRLAAIVGRV